MALVENLGTRDSSAKTSSVNKSDFDYSQHTKAITAGSNCFFSSTHTHTVILPV